jgi:DisA bacterial checkpoint controller nucleotide-binding
VFRASDRAYPDQLAEFVRERWGELHAGGAPGASAPMCPLPDHEALTGILSTAYQATLLREEERPVTFRIIVSSPEAFAQDAGPPDGLQRLVFTRPRPLDPHELRRLSPAAKYHRSLIGVHRNAEGDYVIWGMLQSGPRWLDSVRGSRRALPTLPAAKLVVHGTGPGQVAVASGSVTLGEIRGGSINAPAIDLFSSKWLSAMFRAERHELDVLHDEARRSVTEAWADLDEDLTRTLSQQMVKRLIATVRSVHHGGTLVILPTDRAQDEVTTGILQLKYAFDDAEPRRRFRTLLLAVMRALAESNPAPSGEPRAPIGWRAYGSSDNRALALLDEAVFEISHLIAALADVDGAVVLTKRFEVLGFGAEIGGGHYEEIRTVRRAVDLEGDETEAETIEGVGTRHRSAYRLCSRVHDALVVVVSHDGTVRFVTWKNGAVTYWDHVSVELAAG